MRRNIHDNFSQDSTFIHFMPTFLWGRICYGQDYPGAQQWKIHLQCRNHRRQCSVPGLGRFPGEHGNPLQYSCLENSVDRGAWWVAKSWTRLKQLSTHACYGENWDLRHGASVCMSCVPTCNVCMLVCVSKNVLIWIVISFKYKFWINCAFDLYLHYVSIDLPILFFRRPSGKKW